MIRSSEYFVFDGINFLEQFGIMNVSISTGLFSEDFLPSRRLIQTEIRGRSTPLFHRAEPEQRNIDVSFFFYDSWDEEKIRQVARVLYQNRYVPLWFSEDPERIYNVIYSGASPQIIHNGLKQGYVTISFTTDSPYSYSPLRSTEEFEISPSQQVEVINGGDLPIRFGDDDSCRPQMYFQKINGAGDITIFNEFTNQEVKFTDIANEEIVWVDNEKKTIISNLPDIYRYNNHNGEFLEFKRNSNLLTIEGDCKIKFRWRERFLVHI